MPNYSLRSSVLLTTLGNAVPPVLGLLSAPILAVALGVEGRGELAAAMAPVYICVIAFAIGLPESITYHVARSLFSPQRHRVPVVLVTLLAGVLAIGLVFLLSPILAAGDDSLEFLIRVASLSIVPSLFVGLLRGHAAGLQQWGTIALERIVGAVLRVGSLVILWVLGDLTVFTALLCMAGGMFVSGVVYFFPRTRTRAGSEPVEVRRVLTYGTAVWAGGISGILLVRVDQALVVPLSNATELGLYVVAVSIAEVILVFNSSVRDVMFARTAASAGDEVPRAARISTGVTLFLGLVVTVGSFLLIAPVFGVEFDSAKWLVLILVIATVVGNPGSVAGASLSGLGHPWLRSVALTMGLLINVAFVFLLVPQWGAVGAATAMIFTNLVAGGTSVLLFCRFTRTRASAFYLPKRSDLVYYSLLARKFLPRKKTSDE